jgi:hypothetical protein
MTNQPFKLPVLSQEEIWAINTELRRNHSELNTFQAETQVAKAQSLATLRAVIEYLDGHCEHSQFLIERRFCPQCYAELKKAAGEK